MLGRAFVTLYLFVVLVILGAGWGLDRLYVSLADSEPSDPIKRAFFVLLESDVKAAVEVGNAKPLTQLQRQLDQLGLTAQVYQLADFADSTLKQDILAGAPVVLSAEQQRQIYYRLRDTDLVVRLILPLDSSKGGVWYRLLLLAFYLLLALVIYLWIGPLVRDLRSLEKQARLIGRADLGGRVHLNSRSAVYPVSQEFNRMQQRIDELLASYREMTLAVSHELRTPLARMKFALELAEGDATAEQRRRQMLNLRCDVAQMDGLISQLLHYAGFETHSQTLTLQLGAPGALCALLENLRDSLAQRDTNTTTAQLEFTITDNLADKAVWCEWHLLERVLQNLLGNAAKYAKSQVLVSLEFARGHYQITVEDDGFGIAEAERERVFDSFVRLPQKPCRDTQGFGLGLAIVKRIMDWHGGTVTVGRSAALGGARFIVRWPEPEPKV